MRDRESDSPILLGVRESRAHGEGVDEHPQPSGRGASGRDRPGQLLPIFLKGISRKAKRERRYRFKSLYGLLNHANLKMSYQGLNKRAAAGVDRQTWREYGRDLDRHLAETVEALKAKRYKAKMVRRVQIPKTGGKLRSLGIPAISDKVLQSTVAQILSGIYEQDFLPFSHGYRPGRGVRAAIQDLRKGLDHRCAWVVDADIRGFFDNIDHDWMERMLEERVNDRAFLGLIRKWLKAGIMDASNQVIHPATGTPQGGIISPVLANVYLHYSLDLWFEKVFRPGCRGVAFLVRYADDIVAGFQFHEDAQRFREEMARRLGKFHLSLAEDKTRVIRFSRFRKRESVRFDFLGFEFRWGASRRGHDIVKMRTSTDKFRKSAKAFKDWVRSVRNKRLRWIFSEANAKLRGYFAYYGVTFNWDRLKAFYVLAKRLLYRWLNRRSDRKSFNWKTFGEIVDYYGLVRPKIVWGWDRQGTLPLAGVRK